MKIINYRPENQLRPLQELRKEIERVQMWDKEINCQIDQYLEYLNQWDTLLALPMENLFQKHNELKKMLKRNREELKLIKIDMKRFGEAIKELGNEILKVEEENNMKED